MTCLFDCQGCVEIFLNKEKRAHWVKRARKISKKHLLENKI
jgi:hypothetical protein